MFGRRLMTMVIGGSAALLLAGCTGTPTPPSTPPSTSPVTVTATTTVSATTTPTASTPAPSSTSTAAGCPDNDVPIPAGAHTAVVGDVDDSDSDATEFFQQMPRFEFGVHTASGATITVRDGLAGPGVHSGWIARLDLGPVAVVDDGRDANLYAFVHCRFVAPKGANGKQYSFTLNGFGTLGTGVACGRLEDGTRDLLGVNAVKLANGRYRIDTTRVTVSADGSTATNGAVHRGTTTYTRTSSEVMTANTSTCGDVPKVGTTAE